VKDALKEHIDELKNAIKKKDSIAKIAFDKIKKIKNENITKTEDQDVEKAKETLKNSFSGIGGFFAKIKSFFTENSGNITEER
jgi:hypothetical protein